MIGEGAVVGQAPIGLVSLSGARRRPGRDVVTYVSGLKQSPKNNHAASSSRRCHDRSENIDTDIRREAMRLPLGLLSSVAGGLLVATVAALGCANDSRPATTQPPISAPPSPPPQVTTTMISGTVFEHTADGRRPAAGVALVVLSDLVATVTSDAEGRYSAQASSGSVTIAPAATQAYMSPCPSGTVWLSVNPNRTIDVDVVSTSLLSSAGAPASYPTTSKWGVYVSGTVTEATADGPRPVAGALVTLGPPGEPFHATTLSDSLGRYLLCSSPVGSGTDQLMPLSVTKDGYIAGSRDVLGGWDGSIGAPVIVQLLRK